MKITLAIDAMGGDKSPGVIIEGIAIAQRRYPELFCLLYGDENEINPLLKQHPLDLSSIKVVHTDEYIPSEMKPSAAVRGPKGASMRLAIEAVANGEAQAVVSAGNTGAYMALSKLILRPLKGIDRPAIAAPLPTLKGQSLMLDLGANVECTTDNLLQFAMMGEVFAREVMGKKSPSIGLLNVGVEDLKGNSTTKTTYNLLKTSGWVENFYGFVEGNDILHGTVDVIVTDGFTGNISLKTAEGTFKLFKDFFVSQFTKNLWRKICYLFAKSSMRAFKNQFDPRVNNGAPFLGLNGISVKSHGNMDGLGISYAIGVAVDMVRRDVNKLIRDGLEKRQQLHITDDTSCVAIASEPA